MFLTIIFGVLAGLAFSAGGVLQQKEASATPTEKGLSPGLILDLLKKKLWLAGIALAALSYGFKSLALAFGPLSVVQPLITTELIFAIPVSVRRHGERLGKREWTGAALVAGGIAVAILSSNPSNGNSLPPLIDWAYVLGGAALLAGGAMAIGQQVEGPIRASLYATAAAVLLATQGALLSATVALFKNGIVDALTGWQTYAMALAAIAGMTLVQNAYNAGPLPASMPVMDAVNPLVAVAIGITIFNETINTSTLALTGTVGGIAALLTGIFLLDTSPLVARVQREEREEQEENAEEGRRGGDVSGGDRSGGSDDDHDDRDRDGRDADRTPPYGRERAARPEPHGSVLHSRDPD